MLTDPLLCTQQLHIPQRLAPTTLAWSRELCIALVGANGSGKSTLLSALAGVAGAAARQQVTLAGNSLATISAATLALQRAMLPQRQVAPLAMPVFEVLRLTPSALAASPEQLSAAVATLSEPLGLAPLLARNFATLSGGEQQRVLIARTLLQLWPSLNPHGQVLLLDEPLAALDWPHQMALLALLTELKQRYGWLIVVAIHEVNCALQWADQVVGMKAGEIVHVGPPASFTAAHIEQLFGLTTTQVEAGGRHWFMPSAADEQRLGARN
ncbi:MAG: ATP-binding cassette domain-containing protein [Aeromonas sp.]